jgi:cellobiose dehydrogenase (acceptor)
MKYVVDGSIHPDLPTGNIQTTIMVVAEAAAARILAQ